MNKPQLNYVMDLLNITAINRRSALENIILHDDTAYSVELFYSLPKNTMNREAIKCSKKWGECLDITMNVNRLLTEKV